MWQGARPDSDCLSITESDGFEESEESGGSEWCRYVFCSCLLFVSSGQNKVSTR